MKDIDALLRGFDAEPSAQLTAAETARSERLLAQLTQCAPAASRWPAATRPAAVRRPPRIRRPLWTAGVAAAALAVGVVAGSQFAGHAADRQKSQTSQAQGPSGLTSIEVADWTAAPAHPPLTSPVVQRAADACLAGFPALGAAQAADISDVDQRGSVITLAATDPVSRTTVWCLTASAHPVYTQLVSSPQWPLAAIGATGVNVRGYGWSGSGSDEVSFAYGQAGADVTGLSLKTPAGETITATVQNGLWSLWWPPSDPSTGDLGATATWTTAGGATYSAPLLSLSAVKQK
jgi:hypothetical protein